MLGLLQPLSVIAIAWIAWGEVATSAAAIGAAVMLAATAFSALESRRGRNEADELPL